MEEIQNIITSNILWQKHISELGAYDITKSNESFKYDSKNWKYYNSGLAREVYVSDCGKFVIKIPIVSLYSIEDLNVFLEDKLRYAPPSITHNIGEALAYKECPKKFKKFLAKTELIDNAWVKQEFVDVFETYTGNHELREIGRRKDGSYCLFDYDPLLSDFRFEGCRWEMLPDLIEKAIIGIKNK